MKIFIILIILFNIVLYSFNITYANTFSFKGSDTVSKSTILYHIGTSLLPAKKINKIIKNLYHLNCFSEIYIFVDKNSNTKIYVKEKLIIRDIIITGNFKVPSYIIKNNIDSRKRKYFSHFTLKNDIAKIKLLYKKLGYFLTVVCLHVVKKNDSFVTIVYKIIETKKIRVDHVSFKGNNHFSTKQLKKIIVSKHSLYHSLFFSNTYLYQQVLLDIKLLQHFYFNRGFISFRLIKSYLHRSTESNSISLLYIISEGNRYSINNINIVCKRTNKNISIINKIYNFKNLVYYNHKKIKEIVEFYNSIVSSKYLLDAQINLKLKKNITLNSLDLKIEIFENKKHIIRHMYIKGRKTIVDKLLEDYLFISEGEKYNFINMLNAKKKISQLNCFSHIMIKHLQTTNGELNLNIKLKKVYTGLIRMSLGYQNTQGFTGYLNLQESNLFDKGKILDISLHPTNNDLSFSFKLIEPKIGKTNLTNSIDLFAKYHIENMRIKQSLILDYMINWKIGHNINDHTYHDFYVTSYAREVNHDFLIGHSLYYDKMSNKSSNKKKYTIKLNQKVSFNSDKIHHYYNNFHLILYKKFNQNLLFSLSTKMTYTKTFNDSMSNYITSIEEEYIRGFSRNFNPKLGKYSFNKSKDNIVGEKRFFVTSIDVAFPIKIIRPFNVKGNIFSDLGTLNDHNFSNYRCFHKNLKYYEEKLIKKINFMPLCSKNNYSAHYLNYSKKLRISAGIGLLWYSPFGVIKVDYSLPIRKESFDRVSKLRFSIGTSF